MSRQFNLTQAAKLAEEIARTVGHLLFDGITKIKTIEEKGLRDFATNLDIEAEQIIKDRIQKKFPSHNIIAEESGISHKDSDYTWVVDPLDGTLNYIHGHPPYRVGVGLLHEETPILSVLYGPTRKHMYIGVKGKGATLNGKKISVSDHTSLSQSLVMTHLSSKKMPRLQTILSLENIFNNSMQIRVVGSGLASMSYIANGKYDVFYNVKTSIWDIIPGICLIEEAGGKVTDIQGQPINLESESVLVTNKHVHSKMVEILSNI